MSSQPPIVSVRQFFKAKTLLLTGGSGFVGKVLLWTLLSRFECERIYLLLRPKKCSKTGALKGTPQQRLEKEIFGSPIFLSVPPEKRAIVRAVNANVEVDDPFLDMEAPVLEEVIENVQILLHGAASVRFQATLRENMNVNTLGSLRMLRLAQRCKRLEVMVHVSTAYVNSDLGTGVTVEERLYPPLSDPDELLALVLAATEPGHSSDPKVSQVIRRLQGSHFNTYTFTKQLAEYLLIKRRQHVPLAICRPTIIGGSWKYPKPGWVDTALGAGALFAAGASGLITRVPGRPSVIGDQIPVDLVCNTIVTAAATVAAGCTHLVCPEPVSPGDANNVIVIHCSSSTSNPISWEHTIEVVQAYFQTYPLSTDKRAVQTFDFVESTLVFTVLHYLLLIYPALLIAVIMRVLSRVHSYFDQHRKRAEYRLKMARLGHNMACAFAPFTCMEWFFDSKNVQAMCKLLDAEEQELFPMDAREIVWDEWLVNYALGLRTTVLKDPAPHDVLDRGTRNTLMRLTSRRAAELVSQSLLDLRKTQKLVTAACEEEIADNSELLEWTSAQLNPLIVFPVAWTVHRALRSLFSSVLIDCMGLAYLRRLHESLPPPATTLPNRHARSRQPVILIPTHKSYFDFVVLSYLCLAFDLRLPLVAADEIFATLPLLTSVLRATGTFFLRRGGASSELSNVLRIYFTKSLLYHCWVQFFIEGSRSRTGFLLRPKRGLLNYAIELIKSGEIDCLRVLPIGINYGELMEVGSLCDELVGKPKVNESVPRILRGVRDVAKERFWDGPNKDRFRQARISIKAGPPLTIHRSDCDTTQVGWMITHALQDLRQLSLSEFLSWVLLSSEKSRHIDTFHTQVLEFVEYIQSVTPGENRARVFGIQYARLKDQIEQHLRHLPPFRQLLDYDRDWQEWRIKKTLSIQDKNLWLNRVQFHRASILDLVAVDAFLAYAMERLRPSNEEEIISMARSLASLISESAVGNRFCCCNDEVLREVLGRLKQTSGHIRAGLASLLDPIIAALRFFVDVHGRKTLGSVPSTADLGAISSVSTIDSERVIPNVAAEPSNNTSRPSLSECRRMAAEREWKIGSFPLLDREILRSMSNAADLSQVDEGGVSRVAASLNELGIVASCIVY